MTRTKRRGETHAVDSGDGHGTCDQVTEAPENRPRRPNMTCLAKRAGS